MEEANLGKNGDFAGKLYPLRDWKLFLCKALRSMNPLSYYTDSKPKQRRKKFVTNAAKDIFLELKIEVPFKWQR